MLNLWFGLKFSSNFKLNININDIKWLHFRLYHLSMYVPLLSLLVNYGGLLWTVEPKTKTFIVLHVYSFISLFIGSLLIFCVYKSINQVYFFTLYLKLSRISYRPQEESAELLREGQCRPCGLCGSVPPCRLCCWPHRSHTRTRRRSAKSPPTGIFRVTHQWRNTGGRWLWWRC